MATVPALATQTAGTTATAAYANTIQAAVAFFTTNRPRAVLRQTVTQSTSTGVWTSVTFDVEDFDNDGGHSTVTNTSRYTAQTAGWFQLDGCVSWGANSAGNRFVRWAVNGAVLNASAAGAPSTGAATGGSIAAPGRAVFLNVGDYAELQAFQDAGTLSTRATAEQMPEMTVSWQGN